MNNAGSTLGVGDPYAPIEDVRKVMELNFELPVRLVNKYAPKMKERGWGRIVNISSSSGQTGAVGMCTYSSSKGAIITLTRSMAQELGPHGITVNNIPPGSVMGTIMSEANRDKFQIPTEVLLSTIPVRRLGEPDDIANACSWLASDASSYVTGQTIGVNGGRVVT